MPQTIVFSLHLNFDPAITAIVVSVSLAVAAYFAFQAFDWGFPR